MRHPLTLRLVIFEKARIVLPLSLPLLRISVMRRIGVSAVPEMSEPSKRITPLFTVLVSMACNHLSRRLAIRNGIWAKFGALWRVGSCVELKYDFSSELYTSRRFSSVMWNMKGPIRVYL